MVKNLLRKPVLIGPIEFDIVIVRDMSEKGTEHKVYYNIINTNNFLHHRFAPLMFIFWPQ